MLHSIPARMALLGAVWICDNLPGAGCPALCWEHLCQMLVLPAQPKVQQKPLSPIFSDRLVTGCPYPGQITTLKKVQFSGMKEAFGFPRTLHPEQRSAFNFRESSNALFTL